MLKKIISKALLTVAVDKKARKKINDLERHKRLLKTQSRRKNIEDSGPPPKKSHNELAHVDASSGSRKQISNPTEQTEESNKLIRDVLASAGIAPKQQEKETRQGTSINPERKALITEAMAIRRSKLHILNELDQEQLDKLTAMAIQALNIQIKN